MMTVSKEQIIAQSKNAYNQWKDVWRANAKIASKFAPHKPLSDFLNIGIGKACLLVANGYSFEKNIETIKKYKDNVDIFCCDKTLGHLIENGIKPTYCLVCDANVDYEKYMKPYEDQLDDTILFINTCANQKWSTNGNWKDKYFFVNYDSIKSEIEFCQISGCNNMIPAGTNVSNAMVIFMTQSNNKARKNYFGYDKLLLIGFDYSWRYEGKYYAFDNDANGKTNYMRHMYLINRAARDCYTSTNLHFSANWLSQYLKNFNLPVVLCDEDSILTGVKYAPLDEQMQYNYKPEDAKIVHNELIKRDKLMKELSIIEQRLLNIGNDHFRNFAQTV